MNYLKKLFQQVGDFWQSRNRAQKIKISVSAFLIVSAVGFMIFLLNRPSYAPLYTNLDEKDAGDIVEKLDDAKIPYKITDGGKTILVDPSQVYKTRIMLAQQGLPKGGVIGFSDIFNKTQLGTTDWERQLQYNQALQGELTKTIEQMAEVDTARVHIVQPEKSLFIQPGQATEPSAAVFLKLKPGEEITEEEVKGIIFLISRSVEGMKPENVTVIDDYGRVLSNISLTHDENSKEVINNHLSIQNSFQKQLQANVQSLLEQVFGPGNVVVRVNAKLNFDNKTVENKLFSPVNKDTGEGIIRSIQDLREHFTGTGNAPGGAPGVDANAPGYPQANGGNSDYQKSQVTKNYEINESHENIKVAPGAVDKLTVSVIVNRTLDTNERNAIAQLVGNAIGYEPDRDQISVEGMAFNNDLMTAMNDQINALNQQKANQRRLLFLGAALLAIILFGTYGYVTVRRRRKREEERLAQELAEAQQAAAEQAAAGQAADQVPEIKKDYIYSNIEKLARRKPEDVAKVLKSWLNED